MSLRIEDYALLSDLSSSALVGRDGSIDWATFPDFDSQAAFAGLLGKRNDNGHWKIAPKGEITNIERHYRDSSLVLETVFTTESGVVAVIDAMPPNDNRHDLVRVVECRAGHVDMTMQMTIRFDYGSIVPWVRRVPGGIEAIGGPDAVRLASPVALEGKDLSTIAQWRIEAGQRTPFSLTWYPSDSPSPQPIDAQTAIETTQLWWTQWAKSFSYQGDYAPEVLRSAVILKGLTNAATGGLVAAATTSLPEEIGGERNWDYRYCWLRDATFSLLALQSAGFGAEAVAWRNWLLRAVAGDPSQLQIMYSPTGRRRLAEQSLDWLDGFERSSPVRVGNAAHGQFQLDVYGEVLDALYQGALLGGALDDNTWSLICKLIDFVEHHWNEPDDGIWEVRGGRRHFTHSKVMAWVALDRAIATSEHGALCAEQPHSTRVARWRQVRDQIKDDVLKNGTNTQGAFVQSYGSNEFDASLLLVPLVGFLPPDDARVVATVRAIEDNLLADGFVRRYQTTGGDGLSGTEGTFLMCSFWLADNYAMLGRVDEATALFERLIALRNDVGLLSEEYDPKAQRMLGNIPQAFSHVSLINTAGNITAARRRAEGDETNFASASHLRRSRTSAYRLP